ncbi:MAG: hypothetical protein Q7R49_02755 [Candidatus Daviesbacteria bacterium]|nr:hypothetical protein [Candidatus Daviesbacteria bacterium]
MAERIAGMGNLESRGMRIVEIQGHRVARAIMENDQELVQLSDLELLQRNREALRLEGEKT